MKRTNTMQNVSILKVLLNAIAVQARSQYQIIEITGLTNSTVSRWLRFLNVSTKESKNIVYIEDWKPPVRGNPTALWRLGYGMPNKPRPKPLTQAQACKRWRQKQLKKGGVTLTDKGLIHATS